MKRMLFDMAVLGIGFKEQEHRTGVYRVCHESLKAIAGLKNLQIALFSSLGNNNDCKEYLMALHPNLLINYRSNAEQFTYDYYFSPYLEIHPFYQKNPLIKKILIIYDLIQVKFKEWVREVDFQTYSNFLKNLDPRAKIFCISESTRNDLLQYKPDMIRENVTVIPLGVDKAYQQNISEYQIQSVLKKYGITRRKYLFSISSMNPRKNFRHTIKCFLQFIKKYEIKDLNLVIAGPKGWGDLLNDLDLEKYKEQLNFIGFVEEQDLPILYYAAAASIYPSLYEGFGLPPLESLYCGTPVIASNVSSIPEVVGDAGILINPTDENELISAYHSIYYTVFSKLEIFKKAKPQIAKYNWNNFKKILLTSSFALNDDDSLI